jgi:hypothetical protein
MATKRRPIRAPATEADAVKKSSKETGTTGPR